MDLGRLVLCREWHSLLQLPCVSSHGPDPVPLDPLLVQCLVHWSTRLTIHGLNWLLVWVPHRSVPLAPASTTPGDRQGLCTFVLSGCPVPLPSHGRTGLPHLCKPTSRLGTLWPFLTQYITYRNCMWLRVGLSFVHLLPLQGKPSCSGLLAPRSTCPSRPPLAALCCPQCSLSQAPPCVDLPSLL